MENFTLFYNDQFTTYGLAEIQLSTSGAFEVSISALPSQIQYQSATNESYSFTGMAVNFKRKASSLVGSFYGPTTLFVCLSWLSFQIPVNQVTIF